MQAYSHIKSWASCCILGYQSSIPDNPIFCKISSYSVTLCEVPLDKSAWAEIHWIFSSSPESCSLGICMDGTMLAAVTMPTSVCGSRVISLPDKFWSTTATPDPPGINLGGIAWNKYTLTLGGWFHQHMDTLFVSSDFCEPFFYHCLKSRYLHFLGCYYLTLHLVQVKFLITYLGWFWYYGTHIC